MESKLLHRIALASAALSAACILAAGAATAQAQQTRAKPTFEVDASWPKVPPQMKRDASSIASMRKTMLTCCIARSST